jgi:hypothetical protein
VAPPAGGSFAHTKAALVTTPRGAPGRREPLAGIQASDAGPARRPLQCSYIAHRRTSIGLSRFAHGAVASVSELASIRRSALATASHSPSVPACTGGARGCDLAGSREDRYVDAVTHMG